MSPMLQKITDPTNLAGAWNRVRRKGGAAGVDGVSIEAFERDESRQLEMLRRQLLHGVYHPQPLWGLYIPKRNSGWRAIGVPTVRDRVAQRACLNVVVPRLEPEFEVASYAYREGRSILDAIHQIKRWRDDGARFVVEADVEKCFDSIDRDLLLRFFAQYVQEPEVLGLIRAWSECGVRWSEPGEVESRGLRVESQKGVAAAHVVVPPLGIPQGNVVSPILANVFLDEFDEALLAERFKLVRYADDFVILASTEKRAERALEAAEQALGQIRLRLNAQKTKIATFDEGFEFLGAAFLGDLVLPTQEKEQIGRDGKREIIFVPGYPDAPRRTRAMGRPPAPPKPSSAETWRAGGRQPPDESARPPQSPSASEAVAGSGSRIIVASEMPSTPAKSLIKPNSHAKRRRRGRPRKERTKPWETSYLV